jgi:Xaa-Pro aminopeptidase
MAERLTGRPIARKVGGMVSEVAELASTPASPPFNRSHLDGLMEDAGVDAVLATSPHNVRYLLGGYEYFMYALADSIGLSRYLPAVAYRRGRPDETLYVGAGNEAWGTDATPLWVDETRLVSWGVGDTARELATWIEQHVPSGGRIGVELPYLPAEAHTILSSGRPGGLVDATELLEELRAVKRPHELDIMRRSSTAVVDAILATFAGTAVGDTKAEIFERLRQEETRRGLTFCYALVAAGASTHRGPSPQALVAGDVLSLDSGAMADGWVADLARMGIAGEPTPRHHELLAQVDAVQQAARTHVRAGARGGDIFWTANAALAGCPDGDHMSFLAHGTGLVTHEAPRLTATGSPPYPAAHADRPLREGMVISIESQVVDPVLGFIKLEDTLIVTGDGPEPVADHGRGFNPIGG